jgi:hypothetical protein
MLNGATTLSLALFVATCVLWPTSYSRYVGLQHREPGESWLTGVLKGELQFEGNSFSSHTNSGTVSSWTLESWPATPDMIRLQLLKPVDSNFYFLRQYDRVIGLSRCTLCAPLWFVAILFACVPALWLLHRRSARRKINAAPAA